MIGLKRLSIIVFCLVFFLTGCKTDKTQTPADPHANHTPPQQNSPFQGVKSEQGQLNILVLGVDSRGEEQARSDSIMITQYDPKAKKVRIASIMRDSYVTIPNYSMNSNKINMAYYLGGPELLRKTIQQNFGIDVEHFVAIDFEGFVHVVDTIAPEGIEVNIKQQIIDDMGLALQPGRQRLHGKDLLAYARFRHDAESDFGRVKRQQEVLQALKDAFANKVSSLDGMFQLPGIGQELLKYVDTDMDIQTMLTVGGSLLLNPVEDVETIRIPVDAGYEDKFYEHAGAVLQLDFQKNKEALKEFFIHDPKPVNE